MGEVDGITLNDKGIQGRGFVPFIGRDARCPSDDDARSRDAIAEKVAGMGIPLKLLALRIPLPKGKDGVRFISHTSTPPFLEDSQL